MGYRRIDVAVQARPEQTAVLLDHLARSAPRGDGEEAISRRVLGQGRDEPEEPDRVAAGQKGSVKGGMPFLQAHQVIWGVDEVRLEMPERPRRLRSPPIVDVFEGAAERQWFEDLSEFVDLTHVVDGHGSHAGSPMRTQIDEAFGREPLYGLPQRSRTDVPAVRHRRDDDARARWELTGQDGLAQLVIDPTAPGWRSLMAVRVEHLRTLLHSIFDIR